MPQVHYGSMTAAEAGAKRAAILPIHGKNPSIFIIIFVADSIIKECFDNICYHLFINF
jgi:hypothetical protein